MTHPMGAGGITRRTLLGGLAAGACAAQAPRALAQPQEAREGTGTPIEINARTIASFQPGRPETTRFGDLEYRGGLVLSSPNEDFGGWSGLVMAADGKGLLAVSDAGSWLRAEVTYAGTRPTALTGARLGSLRALRGRALNAKREQDAESLTLLDGSLERGTLLIGFE